MLRFHQTRLRRSPIHRVARARPRLAAAITLSLVAAAALAPVPPAAAAEPQVEALAARLAEALRAKELGAVAVVDFTGLRGEPTELGRYLAEELSTALVQAVQGLEEHPERPRTRVIDRVHLGRILDELELSATGLLDPAETREVGRVAGVDALVTGSLTSFTDDVHVAVKVLRVGSAELAATDAAHLPRTPTIEGLEARPLTVRLPCSGEAPLEIELDGPPLQTLAVGDLEIALGGCVRLGADVHCLFAVTDRDGDGNFHVYGGSRAVLPKGVSVPVRRIRLGGEVASGALSKVGAPVVEDVATPGSLTFEGVPPEVESIQRLEIHLQGDDARFDLVPIRRP